MKAYTDSHQINTLEDVQIFFNHLVNELNISFHPDDTFAETVGSDDVFFTSDRKKTYDRLMDRCFKVCENFGQDIYNIGYEILIKRLEEIRHGA